MSVQETDRGKSKFECLINTMKLAIYTIRITKNEKVFLPEYRSALTDDIIRSAKNIHIYAWQANDIRVDSAEKYAKRRELQQKAIDECTALLPTIQMAKTVFHLKGTRIKYWTKLIVEARDGLRAWRNSDSKRYKEFK